MNDKQKLIMMFMSIQGKIANTYDNADMDSEVEELLEYIVDKLDEGAGIVSSMKLLEEWEYRLYQRIWQHQIVYLERNLKRKIKEN